MIISVEKLKEFITTDTSDRVLQARLEALEVSIRNKTNNRFQDIRYRCNGTIKNGVILPSKALFNEGDTITVNDDLCVIESIVDGNIYVSESLPDCANVLLTKVVYPKDIVMGVIDIVSWILANPSQKAGISSETISRHSVTYKNESEFDSDVGCPVRLLSFLNKYKKARF